MTRHSHRVIKVENKDRVIFDGFHSEEDNADLAAAAPVMLDWIRLQVEKHGREGLPKQVLELLDKPNLNT